MRLKRRLEVGSAGHADILGELVLGIVWLKRVGSAELRYTALGEYRLLDLETWWRGGVILRNGLKRFHVDDKGRAHE